MMPQTPRHDLAQGGEPPSAPLHIIAYVDRRMREHTEHVESILREHVADEMCRFGEIQGAIKALRERAEELELRNAARHTEIMGVLGQHTCRLDDVEQAFLVDHEGNPDYHDHHQDHDTRSKAAQRWESLKTSTTANVVTWVSIASLGWLSYVVILAVKAWMAGP